MRQPLICHCNFLDPGSVGASTFGLPSLVVLSGAVEEHMPFSMLGSLCEAAVIQVVLFANPPRSDPSFCRGYKKMLHKETDREIRQRLEVSIIRRTRCSFCISVGCVTFERGDGGGCAMERDRKASKMVMLDFAFPLETGVALWTSRTAAITGGRCKKTGGY